MSKQKLIYDYEYEWDKYYCYPNSNVLKNKLNITDSDELLKAERKITALKTAQATVNRLQGNFDFEHLKSIHRFLFCNIYEWAGKIRTVNISKGNQFCRCDYIEEQMNNLLLKLKTENYLVGNNKEELAKRLAYYLSEINVIHPFREGNGRTQRMFIEYLSYNAGYQLDFNKISKDEMLEASVRAYALDYGLMEKIILKALS